jgi:hypothetical protein
MHNFLPERTWQSRASQNVIMSVPSCWNWLWMTASSGIPFGLALVWTWHSQVPSIASAQLCRDGAEEALWLTADGVTMAHASRPSDAEQHFPTIASAHLLKGTPRIDLAIPVLSRRNVAVNRPTL